MNGAQKAAATRRIRRRVSQWAVIKAERAARTAMAPAEAIAMHVRDGETTAAQLRQRLQEFANEATGVIRRRGAIGQERRRSHSRMRCLEAISDLREWRVERDEYLMLIDEAFQ